MPIGVEGRGHLVRRRQQVEFVRAACAGLQHGRRRITTGVHLDRVQLDVGQLDIGAGCRLARVNIILGAGPAVLRVQAVGRCIGTAEP